MSYEIVLEKRARKFIEKQTKPERERIIRVIFTKEDSVLLITVVDAGNRGQYTLSISSNMYAVLYANSIILK